MKLINNLSDPIIRKLRASSFGFVEDEKYFKNGLCPNCKRKELYIRKDSLFKIVCNRKNKCGFTITIKELFPELISNLKQTAPATKEFPNNTAETYLFIVRGFKELSLFKDHYHQASRIIQGNEYPTVRFPLDDFGYWEKLIECPHRHSHFEGSYAGRAWTIHASDELKGDIYLTEAIFDAMSLESIGKKAVSVMSALHIPDEFLQSHLSKGILWYVAYDNDKAGIDGAKKIGLWLRSKGEKVKLIFPEEGKDWNDHLIDRKLKQAGFLEECRFRGKLIEAGNAEEYGKILSKKYQGSLCFKYNGCYYGVSNDKKTIEVSRQSNFTLELLYTLFNEATEETQYVFKVIYQNKKKSKEIRLSSAKISNLQAFREAVLSSAPGAIWKGQQQNIYFNLLENYFKKPPSEVRCVEQIGYDEESDSYIFTDHAYNSEGRFVKANQHDFIELLDAKNSKIKVIANARKNKFKISKSFDWSVFNTLVDAWGWEGYCVSAMWFMSLFCEQIGQALSWFPFLSIYGPPNTGKSTLIIWLWKLLGRDFEGIQATNNFTEKYIGRNLALFSSIPTVIKEINNANTKFDTETLLPAFDRDSVIGRAQKTNGLETNEYPFKTALFYVQNEEPFISRQLKSRVISLHFCNKRFNLQNKTSLDASRRIKDMNINEVSGFRHVVLSSHKLYVQQILSSYRDLLDQFISISETSRVAQNYALLWSGCNVLGQHIERWVDIREACFEYLKKSINEKEIHLLEDDFIVKRFFEVLDSLVTSGRLQNHAPPMKHSVEIRFTWTQFTVLAGKEDGQNDLFRDVPGLQKALKGTARFIRYDSMHSHIDGRNQQLWAFSGDYRGKNQSTDRKYK